MKRVGMVWYPDTPYWNMIAKYAACQRHRAFITEKNKLNHKYKAGGKPPLIKLKWLDKFGKIIE